MDYIDQVYGKISITEPVIIDLINSKTLQRLKDIQQSGYYEPHFPGTKFSRFEHSVGAYNLLSKYRASIEEQIAGLIHDVSHSAFSHTIDYVLAGGSQTHHDHQDNIFSDFVKKSDIPEILKKHKINLDYILDEKNFPLQETKIPDLCADRIDYSLRLAVRAEKLFGMGPKEVQYVLKGLGVAENRWVFSDFDHASRFSKLFLTLNDKYFSSLSSGVMFRTMADYLIHALSQNYIYEQDLYTTDSQLLAKIKPFHEKDKELQKLFDRVTLKVGFKIDPDNYDEKVICKSRIVDPLFWEDGEIKRVSDIDPNWKEVLKKQGKPKEYFIKFEN